MRKSQEEFDNHVASITVAVPEQSDSSSILAMALVWHIAGETQLLEVGSDVPRIMGRPGEESIVGAAWTGAERF